jgi:general nucleoside transport system permease protein
MNIISAFNSIFIPLFLAALGELVVERTGIVNLGIEGNMVLGAFVGWLFAIMFNSIILGLIAALFAGIIISILFWSLIDIFEIKQHIVGLGINFLCFGLAYTIFRMLPIDSREISTNYIPNNKILFLFVCGLVLFIYVVTFFIKKFSIFLKLNLVGNNLRTADLLGINYKKTRLITSIIGISLVFISGALLSTVIMQKFTIGLISGKGWIALCLVIFSRWKLIFLIPSIMFWSTLEIAQFIGQSSNLNIPYQLLLMIPYLGCFLLVVIFGTGESMPKMLLRQYKRQEDAS